MLVEMAGPFVWKLAVTVSGLNSVCGISYKASPLDAPVLLTELLGMRRGVAVFFQFVELLKFGRIGYLVRIFGHEFGRILWAKFPRNRTNLNHAVDVIWMLRGVEHDHHSQIGFADETD